MSFEISFNNKILWEDNHALMYDLYITLIDIITEKNIQINESVDLSINKLFLTVGDTGFNLAKYLKSKEDLFMFAGFINQAIEIMEKDLSLTVQQREYLWSFHSKIINCSGDFKD